MQSHLQPFIEMCRITSTLHTYPKEWIGREKPVPLTAWSPDLTPLEYFLWGGMKSMVYGISVTSEEDLLQESPERLKVLQDNCTWVICVKLSTADAGSAMT